MAAETHAKVSGTWQRINKAGVKVSGTWRDVQEIWVKVSGVWQKVFQYLAASLANRGVFGISSAGYRLNSSGAAEESVDGGTWTNVETWLDAGPNSSFESRATVTSGSLSSGTSGAWEVLSTTRTWTRTADVGTHQQCVFTLEIRRTTDNTVLTSATITLDANNT